MMYMQVYDGVCKTKYNLVSRPSYELACSDAANVEYSLYFSVSHQFNHGKMSRRGLELHNLKLGPSFVIPVHDILYITATPFSLNSVSLDLYCAIEM